MLAFPDVIKFLTNEFSGLGRRSFAFFGVAMRTFHYFFFWHGIPFQHRGGALQKQTSNNGVSRGLVEAGRDGIQCVLAGAKDFC